MEFPAASDFIGSGIFILLKEVKIMEKIEFVQICKENEETCEIAKELWVPFIKEVNEHDGKIPNEAKISDGLKKRIDIQGKRKDMHFEILFLNDTPVAIAMFAIDLGTVYGLLEKGYGTVMGFYIHPQYRRMGLGRKFWFHIEDTLRADGALNFYICPDSVTGVPFWTKMGFEDSGLIDPDENKPIYTKQLKNSIIH